MMKVLTAFKILYIMHHLMAVEHTSPVGDILRPVQRDVFVSPRPVGPEIGLDIQPRLTYRVPTPDEEWQRVSGYLSNVSYYWGHGYRLTLPDHPSFLHFLKEDSRYPKIDTRPQSERLAELKPVFYEDVYKADDYEEGLEVLEAGSPRLEQVFPIMREHERLWGFVIPANGYEVVPTFYGTTGSYNSRSNPGRLTVRYTGSESLNTMTERTAHEVVHIGLNPLVQQYRLKHNEKESLIDSYFRIHLADQFPDFEAQGPYILEYALPYNAGIRDLLRYITTGQYDIPEMPDYYPIDLNLDVLTPWMQGRPLTQQNSRFKWWEEWRNAPVPKDLPAWPHLYYDIRHTDWDFFGNKPHGRPFMDARA